MRVSTPVAHYFAGPAASSPAAGPDGADERRVELLPTGLASAETSLAIAADGTLVIGPAFGREGVGVARSRDRGEHWELRVPGGRRHRRIQPFVNLDPVTGRLFFKTARFDVMPPRPFASGYDLSTSDDLGETWTQQVAGRRMRDWSKLIVGPAPPDDEDRRRITYLSGPVPFSTRIWPLVPQRYQGMYRSRDGGATWTTAPRGRRLGIDSAREPGVPRWEHISYGNGVVGPDGTLWLSGRRGATLGVACSEDGGANWSVTTVPGSALRPYRNPLHYVTLYSNYLLAETIAVDAAGTLMTIWPDASDVLHGAWSTDRGATWSAPVVVSAPGVTDVRCLSIVARPGATGTFALAYYGRDRRRGRAFDVHLAEVVGVGVDPQPVFTGAQVNDPDRPAFPAGFDPGYLRILLGGDLNEILQARYAPDGTLYVAFAARMSGANRAFALAPESRRHRVPRITGPMQAMLGRLAPAGSLR